MAGLRAIGRNGTQTRLIDAINEETDFNAGELELPINWTNATPRSCPRIAKRTSRQRTARPKVVFDQGSSVLVCVGPNGANRFPLPPDTSGG